MFETKPFANPSGIALYFGLGKSTLQWIGFMKHINSSKSDLFAKGSVDYAKLLLKS